MKDQKHKIVLNGKVYDVKTGKKVDAHAVMTTKKPTSATRQVPKQKVIDGVIANSKSRPSHKNHHKPTINSHSQPAQQPKSTDKNITLHTPHHAGINQKPHNINHVKKHRPEKAVTLMRRVVSPPSKHSELARSDQNSIALTDKEGRLRRAKSIKKSEYIQRFPVSPQSAEDFLAPPLIKVTEQTTAIEPEKNVTSDATVSQPKTTKTRQEKIFEKAIENADSHKSLSRANHQKHHRQKLHTKRRTFRYASGALATLLLIGFVLYQNIPNLSMRIASSKAGFSASLPGYNPSGYALSGPVVYSPGKITVNFSSNSDDRNYSLTQQVSNWNSQALIDNFFAVDNKEFQTYQEKGKTIFLYGDKNATWVSGGVWYQIQDADELSSDQILNIASST